MPFDGGFHIFRHKQLGEIRTDDICAEPFLLQELEVLKARARVRQVFEIGWTVPVLEVVEVGDKGRVCEELARCEVVEEVWVRQGLNELRQVRSRCRDVIMGEKGSRTSNSSSKRVNPPYFGSSGPLGGAGGSMAELPTDMGSDAIAVVCL